jgi:hypothetical protein
MACKKQAMTGNNLQQSVATLSHCLLQEIELGNEAETEDMDVGESDSPPTSSGTSQEDSRKRKDPPSPSRTGITNIDYPYTNLEYGITNLDLSNLTNFTYSYEHRIRDYEH